MFSRIVVGADASDSALRAVGRAVEFARRFDAEVLVLTVQDAPGHSAAVDRLEAAVSGPVRAEVGDPAEVLVRVMETEPVDLLILGNRGMRGVSRFLGSIPNKVSHHLRASLLLVDTTADRTFQPYETVVVGTDGSHSANRAVGAAATIAERYGARLRVVNCYSGEGGRPGLDAGALLGAGYAGRGGGAAGSEAWEPLEAARRALGDVDAVFEHRRGSPAEVLADLAAQQNSPLLVAGSRGMTGAARFLGSVPNKLTHTARCDVLVFHTSP